jgi:dGTPase
MEIMFTDLFNPNKFITDFYGFKLSFLNRFDEKIDNRKILSILHEFKFLLKYISVSEDKTKIIVFSELAKKLSESLSKIDFASYDENTKNIIKKYQYDLFNNSNNFNILLKHNKKLINIMTPDEKKVKYNLFLGDYDRVCSSSGVRRLQDKAQVYPLEKYDFVRTRLTHSHEVASISELIIDLISKMDVTEIIKNKNLFYNMKLIVKSASLVHDIGNPPFGHFGENVIRSYFDEFFKSKKQINVTYFNNVENKKTFSICELSYHMKNDFLLFDGNAQGLRVITKLQQYKSSPLNLSAAIMGALIKYPYSSINNKDGKFGYFYSEEEIIKQLKINGVFLENQINPLALILEASDDIANFVSDFEDAVKKGIVDYEKINSLFNEYDKNDEEIKKLINDFFNIYKMNHRYNNQFEKTINQITSGLKKVLIYDVAEIFYNLLLASNNINNILNVNQSLIKNTKFVNLYKYVNDNIYKKYVYKDKKIVQSEIKGFTIITEILRVFIDAVLNVSFSTNEKGEFIFNDTLDINSKKYIKLFSIISTNFKEVYINEIENNIKTIENDVYYRMKLVIDYVSGMTDSFIEDIYKEIFAK